MLHRQNLKCTIEPDQTLQKYQDYKNKRSLRKYHSLEQPKETGQLNVVSWTRHSIEKRTSGKNKGNPNNVQTLVNAVSLSVHSLAVKNVNNI